MSMIPTDEEKERTRSAQEMREVRTQRLKKLVMVGCYVAADRDCANKTQIKMRDGMERAEIVDWLQDLGYEVRTDEERLFISWKE